ncbi:MAG: hypothetical protein QM534_11595 [Sediminibacterium sp.]|nr:hypothetical protein [Sediminibacterium sp.]
MKKVVLIAGTFLLASSFMKSQTTTWNLLGNSGLSPGHFLGTTGTQALKFRTNNIDRMVISSTGQVGIGTASPLAMLHAAGDVVFGANANEQRWRLIAEQANDGKLTIAPDNAGSADLGSAFVMKSDNATYVFGNELTSQNTVIGKSNNLMTNNNTVSGTTFLAFNLQRNTPTGSWYTKAGAGGGIMWGNQQGSILFAPIPGNATSPDIWYSSQQIVDKKTMEVKWNAGLNLGQVVIGPQTITSGTHVDFRLSVDGKVLAKEIYVTASNWADYVFDNNYKLKPLSEVEAFVKANHHLPNIPSAKEISERGNNMGDTDRLLLEKIEELTLYIIAQEKRIKELEKTTSR